MSAKTKTLPKTLPEDWSQDPEDLTSEQIDTLNTWRTMLVRVFFKQDVNKVNLDFEWTPENCLLSNMESDDIDGGVEVLFDKRNNGRGETVRTEVYSVMISDDDGHIFANMTFTDKDAAIEAARQQYAAKLAFDEPTLPTDIAAKRLIDWNHEDSNDVWISTTVLDTDNIGVHLAYNEPTDEEIAKFNASIAS